ncbi:MAG: signal peptidase I [Treponema sp.]|nr:signal peptidase I [Treponema sp.]
MLKAILAAFALAAIAKLFLFDVVIADGNSMEPTISSGAVLFVNKARYGLRLPFGNRYIIRWSQPEEGDVVVFLSPTGGATVKRVSSPPLNGMFIARGDNPSISYDSRSFGPVSVDAVIGRVMGGR